MALDLGVFSAAGIVSDGLVLRWKLDETTGTVVADSVGTEAGTVLNPSSPSWVAGKLNNAFNSLTYGSGAPKIRMDNANTFPPAANFSVCFWFYAKNLGTNQTLLCYQRPLGGTQPITIVLLNTGYINLQAYQASDDALKAVTFDYGPYRNGWHYFSIVVDTNMYLYLDGVSMGTPQALTGGVKSTGSDARWYLNAESGTGFGAYGMFDDFLIYSKALSQAEIRQNINLYV